MDNRKNREPSSFKDPDGYVFYSDDQVYREIYQKYEENYEKLMNSGLYKELTQKNLLIEHEEVKSQNSNRVLKMNKLDFISYPYEWGFSQLKDAALLTLKIERVAGNYGMTLKDASARNVQFKNGEPIFIDTLSFKKKKEQPWKAYQQFCRNFVAPLALMTHTDARLNTLMRNYVDGIPLDITSKLLPRKTYFSLGLGIHIHLHSKFQSRYSEGGDWSQKSMSNKMLSSIKKNLESTINKLENKSNGTAWTDYYESELNYTESGFKQKENIVERFAKKVQPSDTWDLGANNGRFSRIVSDHTTGLTVSLESDVEAVDQNYNKGDEDVLPLVQDLTNPSPDLGWMNKEMKSLFGRGDPELGIVLALTHHLAISSNIPLAEQAKFFSEHFEKLIIEFVPRSDSKVQNLLSSREDVFSEYSLEVFESEFNKFFEEIDKEKIQDSERTIYLMKNTDY